MAEGKTESHGVTYKLIDLREDNGKVDSMHTLRWESQIMDNAEEFSRRGEQGRSPPSLSLYYCWLWTSGSVQSATELCFQVK